MRIKRIQATLIAGFLLLILILPQLALADPGYSISLSVYCGYCGDQIEVTANVEAPGTYRICWAPEATETLTSTHSKVTFTASAAGNYTVAFSVPDTEKGIYTVHLTREDYTKLAEADFEVLLFVKIDPEEGPVDTEVTVSGSGFKANQDIRVNFFQGEVKKGTEKADKSDTNGRWDVSYTIPSTPGGDYTFIVEFKEGDVWYDLVGRDFEVTPEITAPSSGTVGRTIEVKGTGFQSKEKDIEITFDGEVVPPSDPVEVNENGSWTAVITVPSVDRGDHTIDASGKETRARDVPDIDDFLVGAGILVEPSSAYVGDLITVAGGGFASKETGIKVTFDGKVEASGITAKEDGTWETSFDLPTSTYGSHDVEASGDITTTAVTTTLSTKAQIEELSPVEGARGDSVSLTGSGFSNNKKLTVTVGGVAVTENLQTQSNGNVVISFRVPKCTVGKQTLKVTDEGGATAEVDFTVTKKVLPIPLRTSPEDTTLRSGIVTFSWQGITSDSGITYTLEISETADFNRGLTSRSGIEELSYQLTEEEALAKGTYYWRVKAVDSYGNESEFSASDYSTFTVSPIPTWVWVVVGIVVLVGLMIVAYRETKFKVTE